MSPLHRPFFEVRRMCRLPSPRVLIAATVCSLTATSPSPASASQQQLEERREIVGTVAERGSLQPIPFAVVRIAESDRTVTTSAGGRFRIADLPPGPIRLEVTALGYRTTTSEPLAVTAGEPLRVAVELESRPLPLERLTVTATKTPRSSAEVPALVSLVDGSDMRVRGDLELVDALENTPGMMHTAQAGSFESIELRGMPREGNEFETTLLLVDGVPQTDSRNSARVVNLPIDHAAAVEVVRGPTSALYGRTAIGGVVQVLTARPTSDHRVRAELQAGEFGHVRGALRASGPIEDRAGYVFSWSSMGNRGFYSRDPDYAVDETAVFGKLTFAPDDRTEATVSVHNTVSDNSLPTSVPVIDGTPLHELSPGFRLFDNINLPSANFHQEELRLTANLMRELGGDVAFRNIFGYRDIQYRFFESGDIVGAPFDLEEEMLTMFPFSLTTDEEILYEEARLTYRPPAGRLDHDLMAGVSYERNTGFRSGDLIFTDAETFGMPVSFIDPEPPPRSAWEYFAFGGDEYRLDVLGAYVQYRISPVRRLELTAAGRYDRLDLENVETFDDERPRVEDTFEAFSPKLSALVRVVEGVEANALGSVDLNVYASYAQAFKPPRTPSGLNPPDAEVTLDPEDITNVELGAKGTLADGRASLEATYFRMDRDGIVVSTREGPFFRDSNAGTQEFEGVEVAAGWAPSDALRLDASAAFYRNRFGSFVIGQESGDVELTGNRLPLVPDRIVGASARYDLRDDVGATLGVKRVGDRYVDQRNRLLLDPYTLVDASVYWWPGPFRVTLSGRNLFDEHYIVNGDTSNAESVTPGAPRQLVLHLAFAHSD